MIEQVPQTWVYLSATSLFWLMATLFAYQLANWVYQRCNAHPLANPVLISVVLLVLLLQITGTPYNTYFSGAQFLHFLLGPATVALAIPLYGQMRRLRTMVWPLLLALTMGSLVAVLSALWVAYRLDASLITLLSLAPKSVTTPMAMGIADKLGGQPALAGVMVIATGIVGAIGSSYVFRWLGIHDPAICGFSMGLSAHGIGMARAFQISPTMGAFAALGMGLNGLLTAIYLPSLMNWLQPWFGFG